MCEFWLKSFGGVVKFFLKNSEEHEEQLEDVKNRRKLYVLICFGSVFEVFGCLYESSWLVGKKKWTIG